MSPILSEKNMTATPMCLFIGGLSLFISIHCLSSISYTHRAFYADPLPFTSPQALSHLSPTLCPTKSHLVLPMWLRSRTAHWRRGSFSGASSLEKTLSLQLNRHSITGILIITPTEECASQPSLEELLLVVNGDQYRTLQLINMQRIIDYGVFTSK